MFSDGGHVVTSVTGSSGLYRQGKDVADPALGLDHIGHARVALQLPAQPQDLDINAPVEDIFVNPGRLQKMKPRQWTLRCLKKRDQESILSLRKHDVLTIRIEQAAGSAVQLPAAKQETSPVGAGADRGTSLAPATQNSTHPCQHLTQAEWLDHEVIGTELETEDTIYLLVSLPRGDDHRYVGGRPDLAQEIQSFLIAKMKVQDHQVRLAAPEVIRHVTPTAGRRDGQIVLLEVAGEHLPHGRIVIDHQDP